MTNTTNKIFFNSRSEARKSGKPVKDAGEHAQFGMRWYVETKEIKSAEVENSNDPVLQEIFDNGARHLLTQNARSVVGKSCKYRGENGLMCAAGPFIANVHYNAILENRVVGSSVVRLALAKSGFPVESINAMTLLRRLQTTHDRFVPRYWAVELRGIARDFGISSKVVDNFPKV